MGGMRCAYGEQVVKIDAGRRRDDQQILGFLRNEMGLEQQRAGNSAAAARSFGDAIDVDGRTVPAYLNLGDAHEGAGRFTDAVEAWERLVKAGRNTRTSPSTVWNAPTDAWARRIDSRSCASDLSAETRRAGAPDWRCRDILPRPASTGPPSTSCSTRFLTIRTVSRFTRRSGRYSPRSGSIRSDTPLRGTDPRSGVLPRPAHLPGLSLSQHRNRSGNARSATNGIPSSGAAGAGLWVVPERRRNRGERARTR